MKEKSVENDFFEDLFKIAGIAFQSMDTMRNYMKDAVTNVLNEMEVVTKEEFDRAEAIAQVALERVTELEKQMGSNEVVKQSKATFEAKKAKPAPVVAKPAVKAKPVAVVKAAPAPKAKPAPVKAAPKAATKKPAIKKPAAKAPAKPVAKKPVAKPAVKKAAPKAKPIAKAPAKKVLKKKK